MIFSDLPLGNVETWFSAILGQAPNVYERSRRIVASLQLDAGREPTGLDSKEEKLVRSAIQEAA